MSNFKEFRSKIQSKASGKNTNFVEFGAGDVGKGSLSKIIDQARKSGTLNLANRQLNEIPKDVYNINYEYSKQDEPINFERNDEGWWENVFLTKLIISTNMIKQINDEITLLDKLTYLDLSDNKIINLPSTMSNLVQLRHFNASKNCISILPNDLGKLNLLQQFLCSHNQITNVPDLSQMKCLEFFDMSNNNLSQFPHFIENLQSLRKLDLNHNMIPSMPNVTKRPQALRFMDMSYNKLVNFSDESYQNLEQLYLHVNQLVHFPITCQHTELKELCVSHNHIKVLTETDISNIPNITTLSLSTNRLAELPENIGELKMLANLDVSNNELQSLPFKLGYLDTLKCLTINGNQFRGMKRSILEAGAEVIKEYLRTRNTAAVDDCTTGLCPAMQALGRSGPTAGSSYLDQSDLRSTGVVRLSARGFTDIPDEVFVTLESVIVKEFVLSKNKLSVFPHRLLEYGDSLLDLDLSSNQLSIVPSSIESLRRLRRLNISHNQVTSLPDCLGKLECLVHLTVSYNPLGLQIPDSVYRCGGLQTLAMSHCGLTSLDAERIAVLECLEVLDVSNNDISSVPAELGLCDHIKTLNLDGNCFKVPRVAVLAKGTVAIMEYLRSRIVVG